MIYTALGGHLRGLFVAAALVGLTTGCAYVTKAEYDGYWDADGDGWPLDQDCDDEDILVFPYAADVRGDGCDSDCLGAEDDQDLDDWPDSSDCAPDNPDIFPCAADVAGDGVDSDCDGLDEPRTDSCPTSDPDFPDTEVFCSASPAGGDTGE